MEESIVIILIFLLKATFAMKHCPLPIILLLIYSYSYHSPFFFSYSFLHPTLIVPPTPQKKPLIKPLHIWESCYLNNF